VRAAPSRAPGGGAGRRKTRSSLREAAVDGLGRGLQLCLGRARRGSPALPSNPKRSPPPGSLCVCAAAGPGTRCGADRALRLLPGGCRYSEFPRFWKHERSVVGKVCVSERVSREPGPEALRAVAANLTPKRDGRRYRVGTFQPAPVRFRATKSTFTRLRRTKYKVYLTTLLCYLMRSIC